MQNQPGIRDLPDEAFEDQPDDEGAGAAWQTALTSFEANAVVQQWRLASIIDDSETGDEPLDYDAALPDVTEEDVAELDGYLQRGETNCSKWDVVPLAAYNYELAQQTGAPEALISACATTLLDVIVANPDEVLEAGAALEAALDRLGPEQAGAKGLVALCARADARSVPYGDVGRAIRCIEECVDYATKLDYPFPEQLDEFRAAALNDIAAQLAQTGAMAEAEGKLARSEAIAQGLPEGRTRWQLESAILWTRAAVASRSGDRSSAIERLGEAVDATRKIGAGEGDSVPRLCHLLIQIGELEAEAGGEATEAAKTEEMEARRATRASKKEAKEANQEAAAARAQAAEDHRRRAKAHDRRAVRRYREAAEAYGEALTYMRPGEPPPDGFGGMTVARALSGGSKAMVAGRTHGNAIRSFRTSALLDRGISAAALAGHKASQTIVALESMCHRGAPGSDPRGAAWVGPDLPPDQRRLLTILNADPELVRERLSELESGGEAVADRAARGMSDRTANRELQPFLGSVLALRGLAVALCEWDCQGRPVVSGSGAVDRSFDELRLCGLTDDELEFLTNCSQRRDWGGRYSVEVLRPVPPADRCGPGCEPATSGVALPGHYNGAEAAAGCLVATPNRGWAHWIWEAFGLLMRFAHQDTHLDEPPFGFAPNGAEHRLCRCTMPRAMAAYLDHLLDEGPAPEVCGTFYLSGTGAGTCGRPDCVKAQTDYEAAKLEMGGKPRKKQTAGGEGTKTRDAVDGYATPVYDRAKDIAWREFADSPRKGSSELLWESCARPDPKAQLAEFRRLVGIPAS